MRQLANKIILWAVCVTVWSSYTQAQVFQGTPPSDWVVVEGTTSIKVPDGEDFKQSDLINMAQQEAIEKKFGTSITYGNFMKSYEGELDNYEHYLDLTSQFPQGIWKANLAEPSLTSHETEILRMNRWGRLKRKFPQRNGPAELKDMRNLLIRYYLNLSFRY